MSSIRHSKSLFVATVNFLDLAFFVIVRNVREKSGGAVFGIFRELSQIGTFFLIFYLMYSIMGRTIAIRGDFVLFLLSGIFLLVVHMSAIGSVASAGNTLSPIMQHAPMSVILSILGSTLSKLYMQTVAISLIIGVVFLIGDGFTIYNPRGLLIPLVFTWASGVAIGFLFMVIKPIMPAVAEPLSKIYLRAQMITSGKFVPAAYMPASMVSWFDWNPLFHTIDQMRLAVFINYSKEVSSMSYPIYFTLVFMVIGLMGEFWLRQNLSKSVHAGR